jgi:hypothetical protein
VDGAGHRSGPDARQGCTGHARLPRAVRLGDQASSGGLGRSGSRERTSQPTGTTTASHSQGHARRYLLRPESSPNHQQSRSHSRSILPAQRAFTHSTHSTQTASMDQS